LKNNFFLLGNYSSVITLIQLHL